MDHDEIYDSMADRNDDETDLRESWDPMDED